MAAKKDSFNPSELFADLAKTGADAFERVDERDILKAPNFLAWCIEPKFLNTRILPFQISAGTRLFADYCPKPLCSRPGYLEDLFDETIGDVRDNITFLEFGKCPKCGATRWDLVQSGELRYFTEAAIAMGQRAGKSKLTGLLATYVLHRYLRIPNPLRFFNQPSGELLTGTFSALSAGHAERNLWQPFKGFVDNSPWYQDYHKFLKAKGKELGQEIFAERKSFLHYGHKQINFHFTGSQDRKMRGATRIFSAIDELGWFNADEERAGELQSMSADGVYTALSNSLSTMRMKYRQVFSAEKFDVPTAVMVNVSSPSSAKDKIMRLLKDAIINPQILALHAASWQANPDYTYDTLRAEKSNMTQKDFMRDYGAEPPLASDPFLAEPSYLDKIAVDNPLPNLRHDVIKSTDGMGDHFRSVKALIQQPDPALPRMITFDLAKTTNGLGFCMFSLGPDSKPRLDYALAITPTPDCPINMTHFFEEFTTVIVKNFNIRHAFFDRWQSMDQVQRLRDMKVNAKIYSLKYMDMVNVRSLITNRSITMPKMLRPMAETVSKYLENDAFLLQEPISQLGIQILTVRDIGTKMLKPVDGDDDIFRAFSLGLTAFQDKEVLKQYTAGARRADGGQTVRPIGSVHLRGERGTGFASPGAAAVSNLGSFRSRGKVK